MEWQDSKCHLRVCLFHVKYFPENTYFPKMLFSGKENIFKCLVAFQKMLWKIFSSVWLCCWKYQRKHIFYYYCSHFLTFSQLPNKYIISFLNLETQIKPRKKIHNPVATRFDERWDHTKSIGVAIAIGAKARSHEADRCCDRDRREGEIAIGDDDLGWGRSVLGCDAVGDDDLGWGRSVLGCDAIGDDEDNRFWGATRSGTMI